MCYKAKVIERTVVHMKGILYKAWVLGTIKYFRFFYFYADPLPLFSIGYCV